MIIALRLELLLLDVNLMSIVVLVFGGKSSFYDDIICYNQTKNSSVFGEIKKIYNQVQYKSTNMTCKF